MIKQDYYWKVSPSKYRKMGKCHTLQLLLRMITEFNSCHLGKWKCLIYYMNKAYFAFLNGTHIVKHFPKFSIQTLHWSTSFKVVSTIKCNTFLVHPKLYKTENFYVYSTLHLQSLKIATSPFSSSHFTNTNNKTPETGYM